jgi:hypothetical protein
MTHYNYACKKTSDVVNVAQLYFQECIDFMNCHCSLFLIIRHWVS